MIFSANSIILNSVGFPIFIGPVKFSIFNVASAKINGATAFRIMYKHILPGVLNTAVVVATLNTSGLILAESVLSFVGAGMQPPTPAWGVMTNEGRDYLAIAPHQVMVPGGAIFLVVLALNFLGDWLRDRLDPRLRQVD